MPPEFCQAVARALELEPRHIERCLTPESTARTLSIVLRTVGSPAVVLAILTGCAAGGLPASDMALLIAAVD
jgi:hypothetical protein